MLTRDFIKNVYLTEIDQMTIGNDDHTSHAYIGFFLVGSSVEFLGACLDNEDWDEKGLSETRFRSAIRDLFPTRYLTYNSGSSPYDLYSNLRCSLVHTLRPGSTIGLSERKHQENGVEVPPIHLAIQNGKLTLVYEDFLLDFKNACEKVVKLIDDMELLNKKVYGHIISVPSDND